MQAAYAHRPSPWVMFLAETPLNYRTLLTFTAAYWVYTGNSSMPMLTPERHFLKFSYKIDTLQCNYHIDIFWFFSCKIGKYGHLTD